MYQPKVAAMFHVRLKVELNWDSNVIGATDTNEAMLGL